jgi:peroxiredoxin family protein
MKNYWIIILMLLAVFSCKKKDPSKKGEETPTPQECNLSLSGTVTNSNWDDREESAFKLQLIKGDVDLGNFNESYTYSDAQVFVTEKGINHFRFNNLQEGKYTLVATKRGYKVSKVSVGIKKNAVNVVTVKMEKGSSSGFTGKVQILSEDGKDLSKIKIYRYTTTSVFFYLYNGKGTEEVYSITHRHYENGQDLCHYFIIEGKSKLVESNWVKEIKPRNVKLKPNEIQLIEVVIDPFLYLLKEHSTCDIKINTDLKIELSY